MSIVIDNIGLLVTNDTSIGEGPLGVVRDASVVIEDEIVSSVGASGQVADEQIDADGRCVLPGFVDSHTHLIFAGRRADEFDLYIGWFRHGAFLKAEAEIKRATQSGAAFVHDANGENTTRCQEKASIMSLSANCAPFTTS